MNFLPCVLLQDVFQPEKYMVYSKRGIAFVEYANIDSAIHAIQEMAEETIDGCQIGVGLPRIRLKVQ